MAKEKNTWTTRLLGWLAALGALLAALTVVVQNGEKFTKSLIDAWHSVAGSSAGSKTTAPTDTTYIPGAIPFPKLQMELIGTWWNSGVNASLHFSSDGEVVSSELGRGRFERSSRNDADIVVHYDTGQDCNYTAQVFVVTGQTDSLILGSPLSPNYQICQKAQGPYQRQ